MSFTVQKHNKSNIYRVINSKNQIVDKVIILMESPDPDKKYRVVFTDNKHVDFGARDYKDYTIYSSKYPKATADVHKEHYILRHEAMGTENWKDWRTSGFWSRWLLWNMPTIKESIQDIEKRIKMKIIQI